MRVAIYVRISQDRTGEELGVDRQRDDCVALAERRGWTVLRVYVDNDVSAKGHVQRPQWEAMMGQIEAGQVDVVIGWTIDRTLRSGRDRLRMLDAGRAHGLLIALVRGSDMDLGTPSGRLVADMLGALALAEIEIKSDRQKAAHRQAAAQGRRIGGRRPFGYEQDGMTVRPDEAAAVVAAYSDYLAGMALIAIARRWNDASLLSGWTRPDGSPSQWNHSGVRSVLRNARYAGFRVHNGEVAGRAQWPPLVPESTYRAAVALLDSAASQTKPKGGRRLLTGIARCGVCEQPIHVGGNKAGTPPVYRCPTGKHVTRRAEPVEDQVEEFLARLLSTPVWATLLVEQEVGEDAARLELEADQVRGEMETIARERAQRRITPAQFAVMNDELTGQLNALQARMVSSAQSTTVADLVRGGFSRARWDDLDIGLQRGVIASVLDIRLLSGGRGVRVPAPETVQIRPRAVTAHPRR